MSFKFILEKLLYPIKRQLNIGKRHPHIGIGKVENEFSGPLIEPVIWSDAKYQKIFNEIVEKLRSQESCAVFTGAGISDGLYSLWSEVVTKLSEKLAIPLSKISSEMSGTEILDFMQNCYDKDSNVFYSSLRDIFNPSARDNYRPIHRYVLETPFSNTITTNIDPCFINYLKEKSYENLEHKPQVFCYPCALQVTTLGQRNIYHIHGIYIDKNGEDRIKDALLTKQQIDVAYKNDGNLHRFLRSVFSEIDILFVGFSMRDPTIKDIIAISNKELDETYKMSPLKNDISRYMFFPEEYLNEIKPDGTKERKRNIRLENEQENFCRENRIQIIRYSTKEENFKQIENIMKNIYTLTRIKYDL